LLRVNGGGAAEIDASASLDVGDRESAERMGDDGRVRLSPNNPERRETERHDLSSAEPN
jgi:hypothetical protein